MKAYLKTKSGRTVAAIALLLLVVGVVACVYGLWRYQLPKFHDVTIELGSEMPGIEAFMTEHANPSKAYMATSMDLVDISKAGDVLLTFRHGSKEEYVTLTIVDTVAPSVVFTDVYVEADVSLAAEDFVDSIVDGSDTQVRFVGSEPEPKDHETVEVQIAVTDASGNTTSHTCRVFYLWMREQVTLELGESLELEDILIDPQRDDIRIDPTQIDQIHVSGVGTYTVTGTVKERTYQCVVTVQDTTPPVFAPMEDLHTICHHDPDYLTGVEATDLDTVPVEFTYDASRVDHNNAGTYYMTYRAVDAAGNETVFRRRVIVENTSADTEQLVSQIAEKIGDGALDCRTYMKNNVMYSTNWGGEDPVWYGFKNRSGNCYVHALCLQALLEAKGFEAELIWTTDKTHYWVIVNIDGQWFHMDSTHGYQHSRFPIMNDELRLMTLSGRDWDRTLWPVSDGEVGVP